MDRLPDQRGASYCKVVAMAAVLHFAFTGLPTFASRHPSCELSAMRNQPFHLNEGGSAMRKDLLAGLCSLLLTATAGQVGAQQNTTSENKDKNAAEKAADKTKEAGREVVDKTEDAGDQAKKGAKKVAQKTKSASKEVKEKTTDLGAEVGDKAGDVKDKTAKGVKVAGKETKAVAEEAADKGDDVRDKTTKVAKKTGNWFTKTWKKIF